MAKNTDLGGVFMTDLDGQITSSVFLSTENVVGIIFDTAIVGGLTNALGSSGTAFDNFGGGKVVELNTTDDLKESGIDATIMHGLPYYHLDKFFKLAGNGRRLFVSFMNSTDDPDFEAIEKMQLASGGIIYQIGVWTSKPVAQEVTKYTAVANPTGNPSALHYYKKNDESYVAAVETTVAAETTYYTAETSLVIPDNSILATLQQQAEILGGKVGVTNWDGNTPINILLNAPVVNVATCDYKKLPDLSVYDFPKVSYLIGQAATDAVHDIMLAVNTASGTATYAPVGNIGVAMAILAVAPANKSIAYVGGYNLANAMTEAELGFGNLTINSETTGEGASAVTTYKWNSAVAFTDIKTISYQKRNNLLHKKGYIFLMDHAGLEGGIFFSSDQTLSNGDYRTISRGRVMHKSRRVVRRALLPSVNNDWEVDTRTGYLSASAISSFQNTVLEALDANMKVPGGTQPQISGRTCKIDKEQDVLNNDGVDIEYSLIPRGCTAAIRVKEGFKATAS